MLLHGQGRSIELSVQGVELDCCEALNLIKVQDDIFNSSGLKTSPLLLEPPKGGASPWSEKRIQKTWIQNEKKGEIYDVLLQQLIAGREDTVAQELMKQLVFRQERIWGDDSRIELRELIQPIVPRVMPEGVGQVRKNAKSVCVIVSRKSVDIDRDRKNYVLRTRPYKYRDYPLCEGEAFRQQPVLTDSDYKASTGFVVGDDLILTAKHCVGSRTEARQNAFVFGWEISLGEAPLSVPKKHVYFGVQLVASGKGENEDWAVVRLDRKIHAPPLKIASGNSQNLTKGIYIIGHPSGLPLKIAGRIGFQGDDGEGAIIRNDNPFYMETNLDVLGGNSGSPVFSRETNEVIGILIEGGRFMAPLKSGENCYRLVNVAGNMPDDSIFERVLRAKVFSAALVE